MRRRTFESPRAAVETLAICSLPGVVFGTQIAGLLFFLNPGLPFSFWPVVRSIVIYGGLGGLASLSLLLPACWGLPRRARRLLPWVLTAALGAAAILDWGQASHFGFFLPPGMNVRLIKAAIGLSIAALVFFYTALLHTVHRRPYGVRSRVGLTLLTLASVYIMVERREAYQPRVSPTPRSTAVESEHVPTLWMVGIDTATLDAILPLAEQGELPFFARLLEEGATVRLEALTPARRVALWSSLLSGRHPYRHGILGDRLYPADSIQRLAELRLIPEGIGFDSWGLFGGPSRPIQPSDRQALFLWEITERLGLPSGAIGWPATTPAKSPLGYLFSERYFSNAAVRSDGLPDDLSERGRLFRVPEQSVGLQLRNRPPGDLPPPLREALARDRWKESLATFLANQRIEVKTVFLLLPGLGEISKRYFGGFYGVTFEGTQRDDFVRAEELLTLYYRHLDQYLEALWQRIEGPRVLVVASAYGVDPLSGWRRMWRRGSQRPEVEGTTSAGPDGLLLLAGDGIRAGTRIQSARLVDVAPTVLYALGLPIARDLDGRVLTDAFDSDHLAHHPLSFVPSYETMGRAESQDGTTVGGAIERADPSSEQADPPGQ